MKRLILATLAVFTLCTGSAGGADRVWTHHTFPFTFLFGNHIDTHQELRLVQADALAKLGIDKGDLLGWFYVFDSGETTDAGIPILKHCTGQEHYDAGCVAGWRIHAKPCIDEVNGCRAMFLYHYHDHPVWLLDPAVDSEGNLRGSRQHIVQPGSFTHMHWLTEGTTHEGTFLPSSLADVEALFGVDINVPAECNVAMAEQLATGVICPGYFLQITALNPFGYDVWAFHHGGESLVLERGIDNQTHLNLLTTYRAVVVPLDGLPPYGE
jgi:hypothetical protein